MDSSIECVAESLAQPAGLCPTTQCMGWAMKRRPCLAAASRATCHAAVSDGDSCATQVILAIAPDRPLGPVERHQRGKAGEVAQARLPGAPIEAGVGDAPGGDRLRRRYSPSGAAPRARRRSTIAAGRSSARSTPTRPPGRATRTISASARSASHSSSTVTEKMQSNDASANGSASALPGAKRIRPSRPSAFASSLGLAAAGRDWCRSP